MRRMYILLCTMYIYVHCTVYIVQCTINNVHSYHCIYTVPLLYKTHVINRNISWSLFLIVNGIPLLKIRVRCVGYKLHGVHSIGSFVSVTQCRGHTCHRICIVWSTLNRVHLTHNVGYIWIGYTVYGTLHLRYALYVLL